jgi:16S rRNA (guanine966-N2)-methyltransferase
MTQHVRIIGGHHRGKNITFPHEIGLRPTPNRIRETLFNWLMHDIRDSHCLDAFAGSGALGFEAWSRGAHDVTFLEQARPSFLSLKHHARTFDASNLHVLQTDTLAYLQGKTPVFDLIFLDPPFDKPDLLTACITYLETSKTLRAGGLIYTESFKPITPSPTHWKTRQSKQTGNVAYGLHQKKESASCTSTSSDPVA